MNILFWNTQGGSERAMEIAEEERRKLQAAENSYQSAIRRHASDGPTRPITRAALRGQKARKPKGPVGKHTSRSGKRPQTVIQRVSVMSRAEKAELLLMVQRQQAEKKFEQFRHKSLLLDGIMNLAEFPHVFLCEITHTHPHADPPMPVVAAGDRPLSYLYYANRARTALPDFPTANGAGWYVGPAPPAHYRVPKAVTIGGVRFCFWHAPSGNNGQDVVAMYNGLAAANAPFVLFGDLNCDPDQLVRHGMNAANIIPPTVATRISGRMLDYAVTNVPDRFKRTCRPWGAYASPWDILGQTGSDHSPMILRFKG